MTDPFSLVSPWCEWAAFSEGQLFFFYWELTLEFPASKNSAAFISLCVEVSVLFPVLQVTLFVQNDVCCEQTV